MRSNGPSNHPRYRVRDFDCAVSGWSGFMEWCMNDGELLALAAKAYGINLSRVGFETSDAIYTGEGLYKWHKDGFVTMSFCPLTNVSDSMRLSIKLGIDIKHGKHCGDGCTASTNRFDVASCTSFNDDYDKAVMRSVAIVAANIGKQMP